MHFVVLAIVTTVVTVDNALLCGLLLPVTSKNIQREITVIVGTALGVSQGPMAMGMGVLLHNQTFRIASIVILSWMCIKTCRKQPIRQELDTLQAACSVFIFTLFGSVGNLLWLGVAHKGDYVSLILLSICAIPVFVVVALFVSTQAEKNHWVVWIGAAMMGWIAASLYTETTMGRAMTTNVPVLVVRILFTLVLMVLGLTLGQRKKVR